MKKIIALIVVFAMAVGVWGCGMANNGVNHLVGGSDVKGDVEDSILGDAMVEPGDVDIEGGEFEVDEAPEGNGQLEAGLLTAGEWKDLNNLEFWKKLLNRNDWYQLMENRNLYANKVVCVSVLGTEENPCFNVKVELLNKDGGVIYTGRTDVDGKAYLLYDLDNSGEEAYAVRVNSKAILLEGKTSIEVAMDAGVNVTELDLLFMIDTTGSMGDELKYLQREVEDVIKSVSKGNKALSINISVNFYRDKGDDYVVLDNPFYTDVDKVKEILEEQSADGGGDYPEAVHTAINNAVNEHQWREDSVKLCFMVLDAPPHSENDLNGIDNMLKKYVMDAAQKGIRIVPVASSGVDVETEFLMRSYAVMTGGTYIFLTDDSGIGGSHLEPTVGEYEVKPLNDLMVEVILSYCNVQ